MEAIKEVILESGEADSAVKKSVSEIDDKSVHRQLGEGDILLNRFMLMREIGQGGSSRVFRARDLLAVLGGNLKESDIAIKIADINSTSAVGCEQELLLREALSTRHLSHPNILKIYDYHRDGHVVFVAMELVEGETLAEFVNHYPDKILTYTQLKSIINPVVSGLSAAHKSNIIHSDIKPANILLSDGGEVKVIDFAASRSRLAIGKTADQHSASDFMAYTEAYASPGLLRDDPPSVGDDIYSLGCVIFELLSGAKAKSMSNEGDTGKRIVDPQKQKKPTAINVFQWRLLKQAMSDSCGNQFCSVDNFWKKFTRARHAYIRLLIGSVFLTGFCGLMISGAAADLIERFGISYNQQYAYENADFIGSIDRKMQDFDVYERVTYLHELQDKTSLSVDKIDEIKYKYYAEVIASVSREADGVMVYESNSLQRPDFSRVLVLISDANNIYPDSLKLSVLDKMVKEENEQFTSFLLYEYRNLWQNSGYNIDSAERINTVLTSLQSVPVPHDAMNDEAAVDNLIQAMIMAVKSADFVRYSALYAFAEKITAHNILQILLLTLDPALKPAADSLVAYRQADGFEQYPEESALIWSSSKVNELEGRIKTVWLDSEIEIIRQELIELYALYKAPRKAEFLGDLMDALMQKYAVKIQYHQNKGNRKSLERLQSVYQEMVAVSANQWVGEGDN